MLSRATLAWDWLIFVLSKGWKYTNVISRNSSSKLSLCCASTNENESLYLGLADAHSGAEFLVLVDVLQSVICGIYILLGRISGRGPDA